MTQGDDERLSGLFDAHYRAVLAYLVRRSDPHTAQEVAADVFLVAWRRLDEIPDEERPWLLVVARNSLANHQRGQRRRNLAEARLGDRSLQPSSVASTENDIAERTALLQALDQLSPDDRELLLLIAWDDLTPAEAATVLSIRGSAVRVRLHRARKRFAAALGAQDATPLNELSTP